MSWVEQVDVARAMMAQGVSRRTANCLYHLGVRSIEEAANKSEAELMAQSNFGRKSLNEVKEALYARGLALAPTPQRPLADRIFTLRSKIYGHHAAIAELERELKALLAQEKPQ